MFALVKYVGNTWGLHYMHLEVKISTVSQTAGGLPIVKDLILLSNKPRPFTQIHEPLGSGWGPISTQSDSRSMVFYYSEIFLATGCHKGARPFYTHMFGLGQSQHIM